MKGRLVTCTSCGGSGETPTHQFRCGPCGGTGGVWQRVTPAACEQGARGGEVGGANTLSDWWDFGDFARAKPDPGPDSQIGIEVSQKFSAADAERKAGTE